MKLNPVDAMRCIKLFDALDVFAIDYFNIFKKDDVIDFEDDNQLRMHLRSFWQIKDNGAFIEKYITSSDLKSDDVDLLRSWKNRVRETYLIVKYARDYTVFYCADDSSHYPVLGLTESLKDMISEKPPYMVETILVPYKDNIIYDGLIKMFPIEFGKNIRANLKYELKQAVVKKTFNSQC